MNRRQQMWRHTMVLCIGLLLFTCTAGAEVYKYEDLEGNLVFTDRPLKGPYKLLWRSSGGAAGAPLSAGATPSLSSAEMKRNMERFSALIDSTARLSNLHPELLHAVIRVESSYDPEAVSRTGAVGLMQLMPDTARRYGVVDRTDPTENLRGGAAYLRDLLELFDYDLKLALAGYNAGENAVIRNGYQIPPYPETQRYVTKVLALYNRTKPPTLAWTDG